MLTCETIKMLINLIYQIHYFSNISTFFKIDHSKIFHEYINALYIKN